MNQKNFLIAIAIVFCGAALRLVDIGGVNFAPIGAIAVFSGLMFRRRWMAFVLPLLATIMCDFALGMQNNDFATYLLNPIMLFVYVGWVSYAVCGMLVRKGWKNVSGPTSRGWMLCGGSLMGSILFFIISNLGVWVLGSVHTLESLSTCFVGAIPFWRGTLFSDLIYLAVLMAVYAGVVSLIGSPQQQDADAVVYAN